jgi:hypothetical protein
MLKKFGLQHRSDRVTVLDLISHPVTNLNRWCRFTIADNSKNVD